MVDLNSKNIIELIEEFTSKSFTRSEIKRLIKSSSIQMNDLKIHNLDFVPEKDLIYEIKIGKRKFYKVTFKWASGLISRILFYVIIYLDLKLLLDSSDLPRSKCQG